MKVDLTDEHERAADAAIGDLLTKVDTVIGNKIHKRVAEAIAYAARRSTELAGREAAVQGERDRIREAIEKAAVGFDELAERYTLGSGYPDANKISAKALRRFAEVNLPPSAKAWVPDLDEDGA